MNENINGYLIFTIAEEYYGININNIKEVIRYEKITTVRDASVFLKGVINLRGKIIPIIDMRIKLHINEKEYSDRTVFIILELQTDKELINIGIIIDTVIEVIDISDNLIEPLPEVGLKIKGQYLNGIAKIKDKMVMMLNINKIISSEEIIINEKTLQTDR